MYFNNVVLISADCLLIVKESGWAQLYYGEKLSISNVTIPRLMKQIKQARHWTSQCLARKKLLQTRYSDCRNVINWFFWVVLRER